MGLSDGPTVLQAEVLGVLGQDRREPVGSPTLLTVCDLREEYAWETIAATQTGLFCSVCVTD